VIAQSENSFRAVFNGFKKKPLKRFLNFMSLIPLLKQGANEKVRKSMTARLNVNIDHVATVRQARRAPEPSLVAAAMLCEQAGADGITVHLRGDRRHIQDADVKTLRETVTTYLNLEMAANEEMLKIALDTRPDAVSLVPETPSEITTEGGLDVQANIAIVRATVSRLRQAGILASLFIDPDPKQIEAAHEVNAQQIELCTAAYAEATLGAVGFHGEGALRVGQELRRLREGAALGTQYGLLIAAGHGLTYRNVGAVAGISEVAEFNIGHNIIARAVFTGLERAVIEMREAIKRGTVG
jgi:pyridoxine 5-phosphate synthase